MAQKHGLVANVLKELGHEIPNREVLDAAIVAAARKYKYEKGISPGPEVALCLVPIPGVNKETSELEEFNEQ